MKKGGGIMQTKLQEIMDRVEMSKEMGVCEGIYADANFLLDALEQAEDRERVLMDAVNSLIGLCENVGDFSNGNTYQGIDEGNVMAERFIDHIKSNIKALEDRP